jgi:hypothetical protein
MDISGAFMKGNTDWPDRLRYTHINSVLHLCAKYYSNQPNNNV